MATHTLVEGDEVFARLPFGYNRVYRDRGEIFKLIDGRNNALLESNRYFLPYDPKEHKEIKCDKCSRRFINVSYLNMHQRKKDCFDSSREPTKREFAELIGADPDKFRMEDESPEQRAHDFDNEVTE